MKIKTCCELLNVNCDQGRKCPNRSSRLYTLNTDGSDSCLQATAWPHWKYAFYAAALIAASSLISLAIVYVLATGLHRVLL